MIPDLVEIAGHRFRRRDAVMTSQPCAEGPVAVHIRGGPTLSFSTFDGDADAFAAAKALHESFGAGGAADPADAPGRRAEVLEAMAGAVARLEARVNRLEAAPAGGDAPADPGPPPADLAALREALHALGGPASALVHRAEALHLALRKALRGDLGPLSADRLVADLDPHAPAEAYRAALAKAWEAVPPRADGALTPAIRAEVAAARRYLAHHPDPVEPVRDGGFPGVPRLAGAEGPAATEAALARLCVADPGLGARWSLDARFNETLRIHQATIPGVETTRDGRVMASPWGAGPDREAAVRHYWRKLTAPGVVVAVGVWDEERGRCYRWDPDRRDWTPLGPCVPSLFAAAAAEGGAT